MRQTLHEIHKRMAGWGRGFRACAEKVIRRLPGNGGRDNRSIQTGEDDVLSWTLAGITSRLARRRKTGLLRGLTCCGIGA